MPMWATCRGIDASRRSGGYTLLELVVVLAIIGLASGIAVPPVFRMVERWRARSDLAELSQQFERLPGLVRDRGRALHLASMDAWPAEFGALPDTRLAIAVVTPIEVNANGYCRAGALSIGDGQSHWLAQVSPPLCRLQWQSAP